MASYAALDDRDAPAQGSVSAPKVVPSAGPTAGGGSFEKSELLRSVFSPPARGFKYAKQLRAAAVYLKYLLPIAWSIGFAIYSGAGRRRMYFDGCKTAAGPVPYADCLKCAGQPYVSVDMFGSSAEAATTWSRAVSVGVIVLGYVASFAVDVHRYKALARRCMAHGVVLRGAASSWYTIKLVGVMTLFVLMTNIYLALEQLQIAEDVRIADPTCPGEPARFASFVATFEPGNPSRLISSWQEVTKTTLISALPVIASIWGLLASLRSPVDLSRMFATRAAMEEGLRRARLVMDFHALNTYAKRHRPHRQGSCGDRCTIDCVLRSSPGLRLGTRAWAHSDESFVEALAQLRRAGVIKALP